LVAGQYNSTTATPAPADSAELDRQLARLRGLSNSQTLFVGRVTNQKTRDSQTGVVGGVVDVRQAPYNAQGDGVTDDTRAFQLALQDLQLNGWTNGLLLVPAGNYVISDTLLVGKSASGVDLVGEGSSRSRISWSGTGGAVLDFAGVYHGEIRGIGISLTPGAKADVGLRIRALSYWDNSTRSWAAASGGSRNSIADVSIDGSAGTLTSALRVGDDASVPGCDLNNDFHLFQDVIVRGYRDTGIDVMNSQIYNLLFLDCRVDGTPAGAGFVSQIGVKLVAGTLAWFGGGGQNHAATALEIITDGNAPVLFHDATFTGSPKLLDTGPPNFSMIFLGLDHVRFTSNGSANSFISLIRPSVNVVENCTFHLNVAQTLHHFGDYSAHFPAEAKAAYRSLNGFAFLGNTIIATASPANDFFTGDPPTALVGNQFLTQDPVKPTSVTVFIKVMP
jgi:Pectate lyase superfamily protein